MIRLQTPGIQVQIPDAKIIVERVKYVFIKDAETGDSVRVIRGSKEMIDYIKIITIERGHAYWVISACDSCDGDGTVEYQDLNILQKEVPCVDCYGYGIAR